MNESIEERALVVGLEGSQVLLEIERKQACGLCGKTRGCGVSIVGKALGHHGTIKVNNTLNANIGQYVLLKMHPNHLLKGTAILYGVPLFGIIVGSFLGQVSFNNVQLDAISKDVFEMIGGVLGFVCSQAWVKKYSQNVSRENHFVPEIIEIIDSKIINITCERSH